MAALSNIIFSLLLIFLGYFFVEYALLISKKSRTSILFDNQFNKPQAFHESPISIAGGVGIFVPLLAVFINFILFKDIVFF